MNRDGWEFSYTAGKLAEAAEAMLRHHESRLAYWKAKKDEVLGLIRSEGLKVEEKISLAYRHPPPQGARLESRRASHGAQ